LINYASVILIFEFVNPHYFFGHNSSRQFYWGDRLLNSNKVLQIGLF